MASSALETYLNDHMAGATAGKNLAQIAAEEHQTDEHGPFFAEISSEIKADYERLRELLSTLGVSASATKTAAAEIGSKIMRPKFTAGDDDALNAFVTLETLSIGVEGKLCMWKALGTVDDPALARFGIDELAGRARSQRDRIEAERLRIAPTALAAKVPA